MHCCKLNGVGGDEDPMAEETERPIQNPLKVYVGGLRSLSQDEGGLPFAVLNFPQRTLMALRRNVTGV
jgi:hypothetical protein